MSWRRVHRAVGDGSCIVSHFQRSLNMTFAEKSCGIFSLHLPQCTYDTSLRLFIYQQPKLSKVESVFSLTFPEPLFLSNMKIKRNAALTCTILLLQQCHLMAKGKRCATECSLWGNMTETKKRRSCISSVMTTTVKIMMMMISEQQRLRHNGWQWRTRDARAHTTLRSQM